MPQLTEERRAQMAETARENGRKSKGPISSKGKRRSSMNAMSHGLTANQNTVLSAESAKQYDEVLKAYIDDLRPMTKVELRLVQRIANLDWRLERAVMMETCVYNMNTAKHVDEILDRFITIDAIGVVVESWRKSCKDGNPLELLRRYQSSLSHQLESANKLYRSYEERRQQRKMGGLDLDDENYQVPQFETLRDTTPADVGADMNEEDKELVEALLNEEFGSDLRIEPTIASNL